MKIDDWIIYQIVRMATVYSITSTKGNKVYIGSCTMSLEHRKATHKKGYTYCSSRILFEEYGFENCIFTVLEECFLEQRYERERFRIENTPNVVNLRIPCRTAKERREVNKDKISRREKEYREANRDELNRKQREGHEANKEEINRNRREKYKAKKESASLLNGSPIDSTHDGIGPV
jgi:group I intron endonuclease